VEHPLGVSSPKPARTIHTTPILLLSPSERVPHPLRFSARARLIHVLLPNATEPNASVLAQGAVFRRKHTRSSTITPMIFTLDTFPQTRYSASPFMRHVTGYRPSQDRRLFGNKRPVALRARQTESPGEGPRKAGALLNPHLDTPPRFSIHRLHNSHPDTPAPLLDTRVEKKSGLIGAESTT
jgi:hypothetical protein